MLPAEIQGIGNDLNKKWGYFESPRNTQDFWSQPANSSSKIMPLFTLCSWWYAVFWTGTTHFYLVSLLSNVLPAHHAYGPQVCRNASLRAEPNLPFFMILVSSTIAGFSNWTVTHQHSCCLPPALSGVHAAPHSPGCCMETNRAFPHWALREASTHPSSLISNVIHAGVRAAV